MYLAQAASGGEDPSVAPGGRPGLPEAASPLTPSRQQPAHSDFDSFQSAHFLSDFVFFSPGQVSLNPFLMSPCLVLFVGHCPVSNK